MNLLFSSVLSLGSALWVWWLPGHLKDVDDLMAVFLIAVGAVLAMGSFSQATTRQQKFNAVCGTAAFLLAVCLTGYLL